MGSGITKTWMSVWVVVAVLLNLHRLILAAPQVPCFFIFGDSLVDNGNNNNIQSLAKANYLPYGIDFPRGPTGRFSNGKTTVDVVAELLGFDAYIPPYARARGQEILKGVNYASAAAGIRPETGQQLGDRISMNRQLENHGVTVLKTTLLLGSNGTRAREHLKKCLYIVNIGSNDYINNYLAPQFYPTSSLYTPDQFAEILIKQYSQQLRTLYRYGARKIATSGVGEIGCLPLYANGTACVQSITKVAQPFNKRLRRLIDTLNTDLPDARFIMIDYTSISTGIDPSALDSQIRDNVLPVKFHVATEMSTFFGTIFILPKFMNRAMAQRAYTAVLPSDAYPFDIRRLAQL
ncbi:GDSL esterase/lipase [Sesamum alatum]|uniref:GDSL esterase/lipase n=1 Tax=Sesamum alatum TaxID=300844 RepID=A0AAE1Y0S1_9LAMI|nr:GDSL esterase/lipase [Sesamum alatum]